jgi:GT2 family glycosyltransferase
MNCNFALIPHQVAEVVGNVERRYRHQFGDLDYGLRARRAGFEVVIAPGYIGECHPNSWAGSWRDPNIPFARRWAQLTSPKGVPFPEWFLFTRRHYGWRWPYYSISPYLKTIVSSLFTRNHMDTPGNAAMPRP